MWWFLVSAAMALPEVGATFGAFEATAVADGAPVELPVSGAYTVIELTRSVDW